MITLSSYHNFLSSISWESGLVLDIVTLEKYAHLSTPTQHISSQNSVPSIFTFIISDKISEPSCRGLSIIREQQQCLHTLVPAPPGPVKRNQTGFNCATIVEYRSEVKHKLSNKVKHKLSNEVKHTYTIHQCNTY